MDRDEAAFRAISSFYRVIRKAAETRQADLVLVDYRATADESPVTDLHVDTTAFRQIIGQLHPPILSRSSRLP